MKFQQILIITAFTAFKCECLLIFAIVIIILTISVNQVIVANVRPDLLGRLLRLDHHQNSGEYFEIKWYRIFNFKKVGNIEEKCQLDNYSSF